MKRSAIRDAAVILRDDPGLASGLRAVGRLREVLSGKARPYTRAGSLSGIAKHPVPGAIAVGPRGLIGDEQGDLRVHGGPDKAVHCYPWQHYAQWQRELPETTAGELLRQGPGAFGENFSLEPGLDESTVCIGDRWAIGDALFEVSQGRQPCWKLNDRFGVPDMAQRMQQSGLAGWYLRVLKPGLVQAGDTIHRVARPHAEWPVARLMRVIAERDCAPDTLKQVLTLPLPGSWTKLFSGRLKSGEVEDWDRRMHGPPSQPA